MSIYDDFSKSLYRSSTPVVPEDTLGLKDVSGASYPSVLIQPDNIDLGQQGQLNPDGSAVFRNITTGNKTIVADAGTDTIQAAINKIYSGGGGTVFLKNGRYICNTDITMYSNVYLQGESRDLTILDFVNNSHSLLMKGGSAYTTGTVNCPSYVPISKNVKVLVVGGGGASSDSAVYAGGGGGGGGVQYNASFAITETPYTVTIGAGGVPQGTYQPGGSGGNSSFSTITAYGGGGGGSGTNFTPTNGVNGGCGGGASGTNNQFTGGVGSQGGNGGNSSGPSMWTGNGGGGGGGNGYAGTSTGGAGGVGYLSSISGSATYYAGGGGGTGYNSAGGAGGAGGGGGGGDVYWNSQGAPGTNGLGGGGGSGYQGKAGGSGVVIISYPTGDLPGATGGTITTSGGNTIHTFTSNGTFTPVPLSRTVVQGIGTTFTSAMVGQDILLGGAWYPITAVNSATSLTIALPYSGTPISSGTYTIATTISDSRINDVYITNALYGIDIQYAKDCYFVNPIVSASVVGYKAQTSANSHWENARAVACNSGMELTSCSLMAVNEYGGLANVAGNGLTMTSCLNIDIAAGYISGNSANGISFTSCEDCSFLGIVKANGGKGIELVTGNNNITIHNSAIEDNTSDGIKITALSDNSFVQSCSLARNGGYGVNILYPDDDNNIIIGNNFVSNTSGAMNNVGTGTKIRSNIGVADN